MMPQATAVPLSAPQSPQTPAADPSAVLRGAQAARDEIARQIALLLRDRKSIADRLRSGGAAKGADQTGLEERIALLDKQLSALYVRKAEADAAVTAAAATPGAVVEPIYAPNAGRGEEIAAISGMVVFFVLFPLVIAYSRRIWRRGSQVTRMPPELDERLNRMEASIESVAIEVERIGEGQRFVTNLFVESAPPLGAGAMNTMEIRERERAEPERRS